MDIGTPLGLGFASGINAYFPLLAFAISVRWLHLHTVNPSFAFITSDWFLIVLVLLTLLDFVADKIPLLDHTWNGSQTFVRPLAGALVAAASSHQVTIPLGMATISTHVLEALSTVTTDIHIVGAGLLVIALLGALLAMLSHVAKATTRLVSTFTTAGIFNAILSLGENILVVIVTLLALFVPAIMLLLLVLFVLMCGPLILRLWRLRQGSF